MILTTTNSIEGHKIIDYLGIVTATLTFSISIFDNRQRLIDNKKEEAFNKMLQNAIKLKANAIVGINEQVSGYGQNIIIFTVTGTAVKVAL